LKPVLMRRAPLTQGLLAEDFIELIPKPGEGSVRTAAPLRVDHASGQLVNNAVSMM
jgi:hypothetical protein